MPMSERHFLTFQSYLNLRMRELKQDNVQQLFALMKVEWDTLDSESAMQRYLEHSELVSKTATRTTQDVERPALDARIAELQALEP